MHFFTTITAFIGSHVHWSAFAIASFFVLEEGIHNPVITPLTPLGLNRAIFDIPTNMTKVNAAVAMRAGPNSLDEILGT